MPDALDRVLLIGGTGQLGAALVDLLSERGAAVDHPSHAELDVGDPPALTRRIESFAPSVVVNASAFTDVAAAELAENREPVLRLNRDAPILLARSCAARGIPFLHVSTDYVFDGELRRPYREDDAPSPIQVYGASKLQGEIGVFEVYPRALVVRTSTLFGPAPRARANYVDAILAQARRPGRIQVVETPVASPTFAPDLAAGVLALLERAATGVFHVTNEGACSRLTLARAVVDAAGRSNTVHVEARPAPPAVLRRPDYSALDTRHFSAVTGVRLPSWRDAVREHVRRVGARIEE